MSYIIFGDETIKQCIIGNHAIYNMHVILVTRPYNSIDIGHQEKHSINIGNQTICSIAQIYY